MPNVRRSFDSSEGNLRQRLELRKTNGVQTLFTGARKEGSACRLVLDNKKRRVKFKENIVIKAKFLNR
jgi:hypothetical protein